MTCLLRSLWFLGRPSSDPGALGSARQLTLGSRRGFVSMLDDFGSAFGDSLGNFGWRSVFCFMLVSRSLSFMIPGSESGRLKLQRQAVLQMLQTSTSHRCWDSDDFTLEI